MPEIWLEPWIFMTIYCSVAGGIGGPLLGIAGGKGADLARKGVCKKSIMVVLRAHFAFGVLSVLAGLVACFQKQPTEIWLVLLIGGIGFAWLSKKLELSMNQIYRDAIERSKVESFK